VTRRTLSPPKASGRQNRDHRKANIMLVPDTLVALQLRNMAKVLDELVKDGRLYDHSAIKVQGVSKSLNDLAVLLDNLPPWEPG
jgi:hypothetical protein